MPKLFSHVQRILRVFHLNIISAGGFMLEDRTFSVWTNDLPLVVEESGFLAELGGTLERLGKIRIRFGLLTRP